MERSDLQWQDQESEVGENESHSKDKAQLESETLDRGRTSHSAVRSCKDKGEQGDVATELRHGTNEYE